MKEFFGSLEQLARQFECSIAQMDMSGDKGTIVIGEASDPSYVESVETTLTVEGEYQQLILLVDCLQNQERQVWLTQLDVEMTKEQDKVLQCKLIIELYVLQKKSEAVL